MIDHDRIRLWAATHFDALRTYPQFRDMDHVAIAEVVRADLERTGLEPSKLLAHAPRPYRERTEADVYALARAAQKRDRKAASRLANAARSRGAR